MKNRLFASALMVAMVMFISSCGGGGGSENNVTVVEVDNREYVVENLSLNLAEPYFWSDNGSVLNEGSYHEVAVFQDGKITQSQLEWSSFPVREGDQLDISFEGKVEGGGEVSLRVVEKVDGKTTIIYGEVKFPFISGKNTVPSISIKGTSNSARIIMMFGAHSGRYQFLTNISVKRTRIKTGVVEMIHLNISQGKFGSDSGSLWDPQTGILISKLGSQRASTKIEWGEVPIEADKVSKIILTGYSMPVSNVVVQQRSASGQTLGERIVEFYGEDIVMEIVPTGTDTQGSLRILFGLSAGSYQLKNLRIETE